MNMKVKVIVLVSMLAVLMTACGQVDGTANVNVNGTEYVAKFTVNEVAVTGTPLATESVDATDNLPIPTGTPLATETSDAPHSYTLDITEAGTYFIPSEWSYFFCTNSSPELAIFNGFDYEEADPLGTGPMWVGFAGPGDQKGTFVVSQELFKKMTNEAQGVALFCQFNP